MPWIYGDSLSSRSFGSVWLGARLVRDDWSMEGVAQLSFTDVEYGDRRRVSRLEQFLESMGQVLPWEQWVALIRPHYYIGKQGRKPKPVEVMLRMYLLQVWFSSVR